MLFWSSAVHSIFSFWFTRLSFCKLPKSFNSGRFSICSMLSGPTLYWIQMKAKDFLINRSSTVSSSVIFYSALPATRQHCSLQTIIWISLFPPMTTELTRLQRPTWCFINPPQDPSLTELRCQVRLSLSLYPFVPLHCFWIGASLLPCFVKEIMVINISGAVDPS